MTKTTDPSGPRTPSQNTSLCQKQGRTRVGGSGGQGFLWLFHPYIPPYSGLKIAKTLVKSSGRSPAGIWPEASEAARLKRASRALHGLSPARISCSRWHT